jgi:methionyl-tRNA formyltransferase
MRIIILSQDENLYLPKSFATVCRELGDRVVAIVVLPAMSTHGGPVKGFLRHFRLFGLNGTARMGFRVLRAKVLARLMRAGTNGPFFDLRSVADAFGIPYHDVSTIRGPAFQGLLDRYEPELLVSISCPQVIGKGIRDRLPMGCINVHGAPLPRYRGLMPAFWALLNGETKTATTVHDLEEKLDDGDIILQREVDIGPDDTWDSLVQKTKAAGAQALVEAVLRIEAGTVERRPNREQDATYFSFPTAEDRKKFVAAGRRFFLTLCIGKPAILDRDSFCRTPVGSAICLP